jgi:hypothetical protein
MKHRSRSFEDLGKEDQPEGVGKGKEYRGGFVSTTRGIES